MLDSKRIKDIIKEDLNNIISKNDSLSETIGYVINLPSKYIRPILLILSGQIFSKEYKNSLQAALAIEVFHNFTLVHDDIMDNALLRRGSETVHKKWNLNTAILSGDVMLILAYQLLSSIEDSRYKSDIIKIFSNIALQVCKGQELDLQNEELETISKERYLETIRLKTGALFGISMQIGALSSNKASYQESQQLYTIGESLGIAFQLQDDLFDLYPPTGFGKVIGGDIIENKQTILSITANEKSDNKTKEELKEISKIIDKDEKVKKTKKIFDNLHLSAYVKSEIKNIHKKSINSLKIIKQESLAAEKLEQFINDLFKY